MRVYHKAYKEETVITAFPDASRVDKPTKETLAEYEKMVQAFKDYLTYRGHRGLDSYHKWGARIYATHAGYVSHAVHTADAYNGVWVEVSRDGRYSAKNSGVDAEQYCHFRTGSLAVQNGQWVNEGDFLGIQGATGKVTGEHLHYAVIRNGVYVDPFPYATGQEPSRILPYNTDDKRLIMLTSGGWMKEETAKKKLEKFSAYPSGVRFSPSSSAGKYQVVICRFEGTLAEAQKLADQIQAETGETVEMWGW